MAAFIPSSILLELGQEFSSMPELDPILLSILTQIQNAVASEDSAIWLLNEA